MPQRYPAGQRHAIRRRRCEAWGASGYANQVSLAEQAAALDVRYPAHASQLPAIRRAVGGAARALGADADILLQINLAVTEAATNAVQHAYRDRAEGEAGDVRVVVQPAGDGMLVVHVHDDGVGLSPGGGVVFGAAGKRRNSHRTSYRPDGATTARASDRD